MRAIDPCISRIEKLCEKSIQNISTYTRVYTVLQKLRQLSVQTILEPLLVEKLSICNFKRVSNIIKSFHILCPRRYDVIYGRTYEQFVTRIDLKVSIYLTILRSVRNKIYTFPIPKVTFPSATFRLERHPKLVNSRNNLTKPSFKSFSNSRSINKVFVTKQLF